MVTEKDKRERIIIKRYAQEKRFHKAIDLENKKG